MSEWFKEWFETPYYDQLYEHRDTDEAGDFISNLVLVLPISKHNKVLDVACGIGRHAQALEKFGLDVTGIDLSETRIKQAKHLESDQLKFFQHDMRRIFYINYFDVVFSFFTSFGYFDSDTDEQKAARCLSANVKPGGLLVIDYFNPHILIPNICEQEIVQKSNTIFNINRFIEGNKIIKRISISDNDNTFLYFEKVRAYTLHDFEKLFASYYMHILSVYGDYQLNSFDPSCSSRMIMIFKKSQA